MEQNDVQVNFEDVQFFNNQADIRNGGKSQVSSFVSKDMGRISGPDNEMGDFMQNGNSFQNNGSFQVGDTSFNVDEASFQVGEASFAAEGNENENQETDFGEGLNTSQNLNTSYKNYTDEDLIGQESHEQALIPNKSPQKRDADDTLPDERINIYESDEEDKPAPNFAKASAEDKGDIEMQKLPAKAEPETTREMGFYELEEKYLHFKRAATQYEKLYGEYLEKFILCERDKQLLIHKQRRVNYLVSKTAGCQAQWDAMTIEQRKVALISGGITMFILFLYIVV